MLKLSNGKIYINNQECLNPELLFFKLKDLAEEGTFELKKQCIGLELQH